MQHLLYNFIQYVTAFCFKLSNHQGGSDSLRPPELWKLAQMCAGSRMCVGFDATQINQLPPFFMPLHRDLLYIN